MVDTEGFFVRRERSFRHCKGLWCSAFRKPQAGEIDSRSICLRLIGAERNLLIASAPSESGEARAVALGLEAGARCEARRVSGFSEPSALSQIASARSKSGRAPTNLPGPGAIGRDYEAHAVSGCSGPSAFSRLGARAQRGTRAGEVAIGLKQVGEVVEALAVSGWSGPSAFSRIASARS